MCFEVFDGAKHVRLGSHRHAIRFGGLPASAWAACWRIWGFFGRAEAICDHRYTKKLDWAWVAAFRRGYLRVVFNAMFLLKILVFLTGCD